MKKILLSVAFVAMYFMSCTTAPTVAETVKTESALTVTVKDSAKVAVDTSKVAKAVTGVTGSTGKTVVKPVVKAATGVTGKK